LGGKRGFFGPVKRKISFQSKKNPRPPQKPLFPRNCPPHPKKGFSKEKKGEKKKPRKIWGF